MEKARKILVTGAAGRLGANVCYQLSLRGEDIRAVVLPGDKFRNKLEGMAGVEIYECDLTDMESIRGAVKDCTHIIHLAALLMRGNVPFDEMYEINAFSTLRLILAAAAEQGTLEKFVLASTDGTYGPAMPNREIPIKEDTRQFPADHYGTGKYLGEIILKNLAYQYEFDYSIVRFATIISPEEIMVHFRYEGIKGTLELASKGKDSHVWPMFVGQPDMAAILAKEDGTGNPAIIPMGPTGEWIMHMADVRDIAQGVLLALYKREANGEDFLIAGPYPTKYSEAAELFMKYGIVDRVVQVELPYTWDLSMDITKAQKVLGFKPIWTMEKMIQCALDAKENGPKGFIPARGGAVFANAYDANYAETNAKK